MFKTYSMLKIISPLKESPSIILSENVTNDNSSINLGTEGKPLAVYDVRSISYFLCSRDNGWEANFRFSQTSCWKQS